jgi:hypothetical protein
MVKKNIILPDFLLKSRKNKLWYESGMDSSARCLNQDHFNKYPYHITYNYNSRGFRDSEWPEDIEELKKSIWCFGDSFTVGIGSPLNHTWVNILQDKQQQRCINISMDGASNYWIARKVITLLKTINPALIIIQWSYVTRNESPDTTQTDEARRIAWDNTNYNQLIVNNINLIRKVEHHKKNCKIIHSFVPESGILSDNNDIWKTVKGINWPKFPDTLAKFEQLDDSIVTELKDFNVYDLFLSYYYLTDNVIYLPEIKKLDYARDYHHYDVITATNFVDQLSNLIVDLR